MLKKDLYSNVLVKRAISPYNETGTSALTGEIIDTAGYQSCMFAIATGSLADSDATFTVLVQEGDNASLTDAGSVADADLISTEALAAFTYADDNEVRCIGYIGSKRYVRLVVTPVDNSGNAYISAVVLLGHPLAAPVTQDQDA